MSALASSILPPTLSRAANAPVVTGAVATRLALMRSTGLIRDIIVSKIHSSSNTRNQPFNNNKATSQQQHEQVETCEPTYGG